MAIVSFTLSEDGVVAFQNALACILKFSDDVSLEARRDKVRATSCGFLTWGRVGLLTHTTVGRRYVPARLDGPKSFTISLPVLLFRGRPLLLALQLRRQRSAP